MSAFYHKNILKMMQITQSYNLIIIHDLFFGQKSRINIMTQKKLSGMLCQRQDIKCILKIA